MVLHKGLLAGGALTALLGAAQEGDQEAIAATRDIGALKGYLSSYYENLGYKEEEIPAMVERDTAEYSSSQGGYANGGRIGAMYGGRIGYQIGGDVAYDATDSIYGSSAATFTPDTILGPQGNQIQAQTGVNPTLQGSQNPFKNLGFLDTERHFDNNQLSKKRCF